MAKPDGISKALSQRHQKGTSMCVVLWWHQTVLGAGRWRPQGAYLQTATRHPAAAATAVPGAAIAVGPAKAADAAEGQPAPPSAACAASAARG